MSGEVVNLNKARKAKGRAADKASAEENRVKFGRTRAEREQAAKLAALEGVRHAGHKIDKPDD